ncbi:hypothetical protein CC77DRAFT_267695 [Alternaria alternata]|uniref:Uncharacterized protein n=1 Tax=Alternaria alternata TaxID=5599 RepID=A0A177DEV0_ALTAL|nr:hypothetical protein CC77DRAFT_267695 [Alternaria alternata]OAG17670.1 hypothetical protein CC77DRAFT_267695 [Alternaria alternata]
MDFGCQLRFRATSSLLIILLCSVPFNWAFFVYKSHKLGQLSCKSPVIGHTLMGTGCNSQVLALIWQLPSVNLVEAAEARSGHVQ